VDLCFFVGKETHRFCADDGNIVCMRLLSVEGHVDKTDEYIHIAESALEGMSEAAVPGAFLVDQIPWCISICFWSLVNVSNTLLIHSKICSFLVPWRRLPEKGCGKESFWRNQWLSNLSRLSKQQL
jgi:hypothetical protein